MRSCQAYKKHKNSKNNCSNKVSCKNKILILTKFQLEFRDIFLSQWYIQPCCRFASISNLYLSSNRSRPSEVFLGKDVQKSCSKFTGGHPCRYVNSIKLHSKYIEIEHWHGCSHVNLLHIFRTPFPKNTSGGLLL